jgi:TPP-dependent 2-oxoacid decarboxylase
MPIPTRLASNVKLSTYFVFQLRTACPPRNAVPALLRFQIDKAIAEALKQHKPVLIEICRDLPLTPHPTFGRRPPSMTPFAAPKSVVTNPASLDAAVKAINVWLEDKKRPMLMVGRQARCVRKMCEQ